MIHSVGRRAESAIGLLLIALALAVPMAALVLANGWVAVAVGLGLAVLMAVPALRDPYNLLRIFIVTWPVLTFYIGIPLPAGIPDLRYERLFALLLLGTVAVQGLTRPEGFARPNLADGLVTLYAIAELYGRVIHPYIPESLLVSFLSYTNSIFLPILVYWLARNLLTSRERLLTWMETIVLATVIVGVTGLYDYWVGHGGTDILPGGQPWVDLSATTGEQPGARAAGAITNPGQFGALMGMGLVTAIGRLALPSPPFRRMLLWFSIPLLGAAVFFSLTRGAWLAVVATLLLLLWMIPGLWKWLIPAGWIGLLFGFLAWTQISATPIYTERVLAAGTVETRFELMRLGWELIQERPILGWGFGAFDALAEGDIGTSSHNIFLTFLVDGGVVLLTAFGAAIVAGLAYAARAWKRWPPGSVERVAIAVMVGIISTYLLKGLTSGFHSAAYISALFWMAVGVIVNLRGSAPQQLEESQ